MNEGANQLLILSNPEKGQHKMREKWNRQMPLMPEIASHIQARELEAISGIIDSKSIICRLVLQDLCKGCSDASRAGAKGMSPEQVLRTAVVLPLFGFIYQELAFHMVDSHNIRRFCRIGIAIRGPDCLSASGFPGRPEQASAALERNRVEHGSYPPGTGLWKSKVEIFNNPKCASTG